MAGRTNKNKEHDPIIDEVLDETPPPIDEPSGTEEEVTGIPADEILPDPENVELEPDEEESEPETPEEPEAEQVEQVETPEQKEQRYKAQQTEAQLQAERNKHLIDKIEESNNLQPPTEAELKAFVKQDGVDWEELTTFEQATAKRTLIAERRSQLLNEAIQGQRKIDEWAKTVDDFIDSTDSKPEFIDLSSHEADFRKFAMKEAHRGTPMDILTAAFLHNLPTEAPKRGSLFPKGGGGEIEKPKEGITDADTVAKLRRNNPREYARQVKAGKIKIEI